MFATQGIPVNVFRNRRGGAGGGGSGGGDAPAAAEGATQAREHEGAAGSGGWMFVTSMGAADNEIRRATTEQLVEQARRLRNAVGNMVARQDAKDLQQRIDDQFLKNARVVLDLCATLDRTIRSAREATEHRCCRSNVEEILQNCRRECHKVHQTMNKKTERLSIRRAIASKTLAEMTRDELAVEVRHLVRLDSEAVGAGGAGVAIRSLWSQLLSRARAHRDHLQTLVGQIDREIQAKLDDGTLRDCCRDTLRALLTSLERLPERVEAEQDANVRFRLLDLEYRRQGGEELSIEDQNFVRLGGEGADGTFMCDACFSDELPLSNMFVMGDCHHMACIECTRGQVTFAMDNDKVDAIECLQGDHAHIQYADVHKLLAGDERQLERYEELLLNKVLKDHPETVVCPRPQCSTQFFAPDGVLRVQCPSEACGLEFCTSCKVEWHENSTCEQFQRFLRENAQADDLNAAWIRENSKTCPGCHFSVQKSRGCNHMTGVGAGLHCQCSRCSTHFCYRCEVQLPANDPYRHFNTRDSPCNRKLFD